MGHDQSKNDLKTERKYFREKKKEQLKYFASLEGFLENTSEWVVLLREEIENHMDSEWAKALYRVIKSWKSFQDSSSKVAFAWNRYNSSRAIKKIDQRSMCLWREDIRNLQTFSYEIESDPNKKSLNGFLLDKKDCTLYQIIKAFQQSIINYHCYRCGGVLELKPEIISRLKHFSQELDKSIHIFSNIMIKIIPKFFLDLPHDISDVGSIVKNAIISDEIFGLLVLMRKELQQDIQDSYLQGLQSFGEYRIESPLLETLERDNNSDYVKALENLVEITQSKCIGDMHDCIAMLMNHISRSLYDPNEPDKIIEDDQIIQAFLFIIGRSSAPDLPLYLDILSTFIDEHTLDVKDVGKGIIKLNFIVQNVSEWGSYISSE